MMGPCESDQPMVSGKLISYQRTALALIFASSCAIFFQGLKLLLQNPGANQNLFRLTMLEMFDAMQPIIKTKLRDSAVSLIVKKGGKKSTGVQNFDGIENIHTL